MIQSTTAVKLSKTKLTINVGDTYTLQISGTTKTVKWSSSDKTIVKVSSEGKIKGLKAGEAIITASVSNKKYKCTVTVKNNEMVNVILGALIFDDTTTKNYAEQYKKNNPNYLDVKAYDDDHIVVTMYESYRQKVLKDYDDGFNDMLTELVSKNSTDGDIVKIDADKLFTKVKIYADKEKCENTFAYFSMYLASAAVSDTIQAFNLIDVNDRKSDITVVDINTGEILYPTQ